MYPFKRGLLPNYFRNMFTLASQLHSHYTRNCNLYYIPPCQTNIQNFSIWFQGPKFLPRNSKQWKHYIRLLGKDLKNSFFLNQIYFLLSYIHLLPFSFLFYFIFKIIHFNISCCPHNLYDVPYIVRKPIVHKPQASINIGFLTITTFNILKLSSLSYQKFLVYCVIFLSYLFVWLMENKIK